mgnify:CR=1 FL=1
MTLNTATQTSSPLVELFDQRKFTRRDDLTTAIRFQLAIDALNGKWGTVTELAKENNVSRAFIYSLCSVLKSAGEYLFGESGALPSCALALEQTIGAILSFRLEGGNSLGSIATIMDRMGYLFTSVGFISQTLSRIGALLPMTISTISGLQQYIVFASDEIFSKTTPILITVDPCSSAIVRMELSDSRKTEDWKKHFKEINVNGFYSRLTVSDDAPGIIAAHNAVMGEAIRQSDTYHGIAHRLGNWTNRLERTAYKAIRLEHVCEQKFNSAKSEQALEKCMVAYLRAIEAADKAIALYDNFYGLYLNLIGELNLFDRHGVLRLHPQVEETITHILTRMKALKHSKIEKAVSQIERALPDLLHYFDVAKPIIYELQKLPISDACLKEFFLAWQWNKAVIKAKKKGRKNQARKHQQDHLDNAEYLCPPELKNIHAEVYSKLDEIVQGSAMVECINSIVRPYLNTTKNQVTQEQLNLIMFYHNHRRYREGKRKHNTPMELLTGKEQTDDWISMIFELLRAKDPELLHAA